MSRLVGLCSAVIVVVFLAHGSNVHAEHRGRTLAVIMTNDPVSNQIQVYDSSTNVLLQTLSTNGKGGAGGNARGVKQFKGEFFAAVNYGSSTVAIYAREGDRFKFDKLVTTSSAPVSVDFGNDHMYVAGATTVDSFALQGNHVAWRDGTASLELAGGGLPPVGSTAQVGAIDKRHVLVTLKDPPDRGSVDVVSLDDDGAVTSAVPTAVAAPENTLTPFGFSVYPDGTAVVTLAHTSEAGLFRNSAFTSITAVGQAADCWTTRAGKYVFTANTGSMTISRLVGTGNNVFVDSHVAASISTGGAPADIDTDAGILGVIDHGAGQSHLSLFTYNEFGELTASGAPITLGVANANGVAIMSPPDVDEH